MKRFCRKAVRGYMTIAEPFNNSWSYLFSRKWCHSAEDTLNTLFLLVALIPATPVAYLFVAPLMAFFEGTREEGE